MRIKARRKWKSNLTYSCVITFKGGKKRLIITDGGNFSKKAVLIRNGKKSLILEHVISCVYQVNFRKVV